MKENYIEDLILDVIDLKSFNDAGYYAFHLRKNMGNLFKYKWEGIPSFLGLICNDIKKLIAKYNIHKDEIILCITNDSWYIWVCTNILKAKDDTINEMEILGRILSKKNVSEIVEVDEEKLLCAFTCYIIDNYYNFNCDFLMITQDEKFDYETNDYKLTRIVNPKFLLGGFIFDNKYYPYSIFIKTNRIEFTDKLPGIIKTIKDNTCDADILFRLDSRLATPIEEIISFTTYDFQKFRGPNFNFKNTELNGVKTKIVHIDENTLDKLLMIIKKDYDTELNLEFWHIEIETLPYLDEKKYKSNLVTVTFIHAKYYPDRNIFNHIDYIKNQYDYDKYILKYQDLNNYEIPIDFYTSKNCHYKVWCIENGEFTINTWYELVTLSIDSVYQALFDEILLDN